jgi:hypothetical protein
MMSHDSAVGIATGYELDDRGSGVRVLVGSRIFTFPCRLDRFRGTRNFLFNEYQEIFSWRVKRQEREADH